MAVRFFWDRNTQRFTGNIHACSLDGNHPAQWSVRSALRMVMAVMK